MIQRCVARYVLLVSVMALGMPARAGVVIEQQSKDASGGEVVRYITYVEPGRLRVEYQSAEGVSIAIFRADRQVVWMIQLKEKSYQEMTRADVEKMAQQMAGVRQQQEQMLKELPPEQRAVVEKMMKQQMGAAKPVDVTVKRVGRESVGKYAATKYELLANGQRTEEIWAAALDQLSFQPAEYETFLQFARFFEKLSQAAAQFSSTDVMARHAEAIEGFPVKMISYDGGRVTSEMQLLRAERQTVSDDKFQLPPGLKKVEMPGPEREP